MLGVLVAGIHLSRTSMSGSLVDGMHVSTDLVLYSHPKEFWGNGVKTQANSMGKIPSTGKNPQRSIEPMTLHPAGQQAKHTTNQQFPPPLSTPPSPPLLPSTHTNKQASFAEISVEPVLTFFHVIKSGVLALEDMVPHQSTAGLSVIFERCFCVRFEGMFLVFTQLCFYPDHTKKVCTVMYFPKAEHKLFHLHDQQINEHTFFSAPNTPPPHFSQH